MTSNPILLFDLDRTLWDFDTNADRTYSAMFDSFGLADLCHVDFATFHERYRQINDMLWDAYRNGTVTKEQLSLRRFSYTLAAFGCNADDPEIVRLSLRMSDYYVVEGTRQTVLMPGARELLQWLDALNPRPTMAVITNGFAEAQLPKMKTSDIDRYFDYFFLSEDLGFMKPDPRFFEEALQQMHASADDCLVVGDDYKVDIIGAMRAGIRQVWYNYKRLPLPTNTPAPTHEIAHLLELKEILATSATPSSPRAQTDAPSATPLFPRAQTESPSATPSSPRAHTETPSGTPSSPRAHTETPSGTPSSPRAHTDTPSGTPSSPRAHTDAYFHSRGYHPHCENKQFQFITFRLVDSYPSSQIAEWKKDLEITHETPQNSEKMLKLRKLIETYEDAGYGSCILKNDDIASVMKESLFFRHGVDYNIVRWCVMPNHVHVLIEVFEGKTLTSIVKAWRSFTSHRFNEIMGTKGRVWMKDYYDRFIRNEKHFRDVVAYIDNNPVKAGLVEESSMWKWGSAWRDVVDAHGDVGAPGKGSS